MRHGARDLEGLTRQCVSRVPRALGPIERQVPGLRLAAALAPACRIETSSRRMIAAHTRPCRRAPRDATIDLGRLTSPAAGANQSLRLSAHLVNLSGPTCNWQPLARTERTSHGSHPARCVRHRDAQNGASSALLRHQIVAPVRGPASRSAPTPRPTWRHYSASSTRALQAWHRTEASEREEIELVSAAPLHIARLHDTM